MLHKMKLQPEYYNHIKNGTKRIEIRLNDEKRQKIKKGDIICFQKEPDLCESLTTKVVDLVKYDSFKDLIDDFDISILANQSMTKEELLSTLKKYYSEESEQKYKVLGIKIELIK